MLLEKWKSEHGVSAPDGETALCHVRYTPDETEIRRALAAVDRRMQSPVRVGVESALAIIAAVVAIIDFCRFPDRTANLVVGIVCLLLAAVSLLYGPLSVRQIAKTEAAKKKPVNLWVFEDGVGFGKRAETYIKRPYDAVYAVAVGEDLLVLVPDKNAVVVSPRCAFEPSDWADLCARVTVVDACKRVPYWQKGRRV